MQLAFSTTVNWRLLAAFAAAAGCAIYVSAADSTGNLGCLYGSEAGKEFRLEEHPDCKADKLNMADDDAVKATSKVFALSASEMTFVGCDAAPFAAHVLDLEPLRVQVLYSTKVSYNESEYIAPILHEVAHVYQLKSAGSPGRLRDSHGSDERVELGADFLAGVAARALDMNPGEFGKSLHLVGSHRKDLAEPHGRPEDRLSAFRYGYFYRRRPQQTLESQYVDFQENLFADIKQSQDLH